MNTYLYSSFRICIFLCFFCVSCQSAELNPVRTDLASVVVADYGSAWANLSVDPYQDALIAKELRDYAIARMRAAQFSEYWIREAVRVESEESRLQIQESAVLGYRIKGHYDAHYSARAVRQCALFLKKYRKILSKAEKQFGVDASVIAALLWVETQYGQVTGRFPLLGVYFSRLQIDHPKRIDAFLASIQKGNWGSIQQDPLDPVEVEKVKQRAIERSAGALQELLALKEIQKRLGNQVLKFKGSYAGAWGWPQFIPSSYVKYSVSHVGAKTAANLFDVRDAVLSVAAYLGAHGYQRDLLQSKRDAIFSYNHAQGYVNVILKIASEASVFKSVPRLKIKKRAHASPTSDPN